MSLTLVEGPDSEPLTAQEVRTRLGIGSEVPDAVLNALVLSARMAIDGADGSLGRALITQTWRLVLDGFPACSGQEASGFHSRQGWGTDGRPLYLWNAIKIPLPPLQKVNSVSYVDGDGTVQTVPGTAYQIVAGAPARLIPAGGTAWPGTSQPFGAVAIEFVCGYGDDGADVPEPIRSAIVLEVNRLRSLSTRDPSVMVDNVIGVGSKTYAVGRDGGSDTLNAASQALLAPYRVWI